jgi:hypothetical protein
MKYLFLLPLVFLLLAGTGFVCHKALEFPELTGRLVIDTACNQYAVQLLNGEIDPGHIEKTWKDPLTGNIYTNVFTVLNNCDSPFNGFSTGDLFKFSIDNSIMPSLSCLVCQFKIPLPPASNSVINVRKL